MKTEIKNSFFKELYEFFLTGRSFTIFLGPTKVVYKQGDKYINVNDGQDTKVPFNDESPMYETASKIIDIVSKHSTDLEEIVRRYDEFKSEIINTQQNAEDIYEIQGVKCQHVRTSKKLIILADDLSEFDDSDSYGIACAISNIHLRRKNESYRKRERIAWDMYEKLQTSNNQETDDDAPIQQLYFESLTSGEDLFIMKNKSILNFTLMLIDNKQITYSLTEVYEKPSTFMSLAWGYANLVYK